MRRTAIVALSCLLSGAPISARADAFDEGTVPTKWLGPLLPEHLAPLGYPGYARPIDRAKMEAFTGRYKKALYTLAAAADADPIDVASVRGNCLLALGRYDEALAALSAENVAGHPDIQLLRATVLGATGRHSDALQLVESHLSGSPDSIAGHYRLGEFNERLGDLEAARNAYDWFVRPDHNLLEKWQKQPDSFEKAEEVVLLGRALDRWATLHGAYQNLPALNDTIVNMFVRAYDVVDRTYWPAHVAAAEYLLSHDDTDGARKELAAAYRSNPNDARTLGLLGKIGLDSFDFTKCETAVDDLRKVDPDSIAADLLEARNLMQQRVPEKALEPIQKVLARQPDHLEALGLLAAVQSLRLKDDDAKGTLARIEKLDAGNASAYFEVAEHLSSMRQYPRSAEMYKVAIDRAPWWTQPRNGLGLLYTQSGDEDLAQATLDAAHTLDPYNLRTTNYLRLLDDLTGFARKETAHFVVFYDAKSDPIIPEYFADYLESIHAQVTGVFKHEPAVKTYIEVFPTHDAFSVRTTGSPWIGTVGASTGRVIALVAPRKGENTMGPFNWAQVLRHEYTHTVTLSATENRIPHWLTEGLAVYEERMPLRWEWVPLLYRAVTKDELFTMDNLTWGFVRPKRKFDRQLAYAQSFWVCQYIEQTYGFDKILKILDAVRTGTGEEAVFTTVLGVSGSQFTEEFFTWTRKQVAGWGYDEETSKKYEGLREKGDELIAAHKYAEAVPVWEQIATLRPMDSLPHQRLFALYATRELNKPDKAIEQLKAISAVELKDNRYAKRLARLYRDAKQPEDAERCGLQAVYIDPYDLSAHELLADIEDQAGNEAGATRERRVIPVLQQWIADQTKSTQ